MEQQPTTGLVQTKTQLLFLDGLRGIAALYVMIGHSRFLLWEGYQNYLKNPEHYSIFDKALVYFFALFRWGHEFVLLFFVLSGFVIHHGQALKLVRDKKAKIVWKDYFIRRARRIYPPFLFAIGLTWLLDTIGQYNNFDIYTGNTLYPLINANVSNPDHSVSTLVGNLFFLFKEYFPVFGTNGATWSLKFEWWFYMLYPLFFYLTRKNVFYSAAAIITLFIASFYSEVWPIKLMQSIFGSMICWWLGAVLAEVATKRVAINLKAFAWLTLLTFAASFLLPVNGQNEDLKTALLFTFVVTALLWLNQKGVSLKILEIIKPFGDFSYTLYMIHSPILILMSGIVMNYYGKLPSHSYFIFVGIFISTATAFMAHFLVEKPFMKTNKPLKNQTVKGEVKLTRADSKLNNTIKER